MTLAGQAFFRSFPGHGIFFADLLKLFRRRLHPLVDFLKG